MNSDPLRPAQSEREVIGAILVRGLEAFDEATAILGEMDFTEYASLILWQSFSRLADMSAPIQPSTVFADLVKHKYAEDVSAELVAELFQIAGAGIDLEYHAKIVAEASLRRRTILALNEVQRDANDHICSPEDVIATAYAKLFELETERDTNGPKTMGDVLTATIEDLNQRTRPDYKSDLRATGLGSLDRATGGGFAPGELVIIAARPGRGKTAMLLQVARSFAERGERPLLFSLEMRSKENAARVLAAEAEVNSAAFRGACAPNEEQAARIMDAYYRLRSGPPSWIDDRPEMTPARLMATARRFARKHGVRVVLVDYLQLLRATNPKEPRHQQVGQAARELKLLARNQQIVVVCAAQLNREVEGRPDPTPRLSDLRDSGEIEQHADFVFFLHGKAETQHQSEEAIDLICGKGRSVSAGHRLSLKWNKPRMTFTEAISGLE